MGPPGTVMKRRAPGEIMSCIDEELVVFVYVFEDLAAHGQCGPPQEGVAGVWS